eukprot:664913-Amphidinium_carterae.1
MGCRLDSFLLRELARPGADWRSAQDRVEVHSYRADLESWSSTGAGWHVETSDPSADAASELEV